MKDGDEVRIGRRFAGVKMSVKWASGNRKIQLTTIPRKMRI
jgi:hypothetical protein